MGKVRHANRKSARKAAKLMWRAKHERVYPYRCNFCNGWHTGHRFNKPSRCQHEYLSAD